MWKYVLAAFLMLIGVIEIGLALNKSLRDEIMKNSPIQSTSATPFVLVLAGVSAFIMALALIFYDRFL